MSHNTDALFGCVLALAMACPALGAQAAAPARATPPPVAADVRRLGAQQDIKNLLFVRSTEGAAIVKFGNGPLEMVRVGDRLGRQEARVAEIEIGLLRLEEPASKGSPSAQIVFHDGDRGGTRYAAANDETPPLARRPIVRPQQSSGSKPSKP